MKIKCIPRIWSLGALSLMIGLATAAEAAEAPVDLGNAANFTILAASTVTNTALFTNVTGDLGVSPGTAVTGFPPGVVTGTIHAGNPTSALAQLDLTTAYNDAAGRSTAPIAVAGNQGGKTLGPGLYRSTSSLEISSGDLVLDGGGDPNAVFIFQMATTLTATPDRKVFLINNAHSANVFWQVGSSATFNSTSVMQGNVMANISITIGTGASLLGRALAANGGVTLDGNVATASPPYVSNVTSLMPNATYGPGTLIPIILKFNEDVNVTGTPTLALNVVPGANASYFSGSGSDTLIFNYTVAAPQESVDLDYLNMGALALSGGTIKSTITGSDAEINLAAPGTITSLGFNKDIVIGGGDPPEVLSIQRVDPNPTTANQVQYDILFSTEVDGVDEDNFTFTTTSGTFSVNPGFISISGLDGTDTRRVTVSTGTNSSDTATFRLNLGNLLPEITDSGGNPVEETFLTGQTYTVDTTHPEVLSIVRVDPNPTSDGTVRYDVTFSEAVNAVDEDNFVITTTNGTFAVSPTFNSICGLNGTSVRRVTLNTGTNSTPSATFRLDLANVLPAITDGRNNSLTETFNTGETYTVNKTAPAVISIERVDPNPTNAGTVRYDVVFSEAVDGVAAGNFTFTTTNGTFSVAPSFVSIAGLDGTDTRRVTVNTGTPSSSTATFRLNLGNVLPEITSTALGTPLTDMYSLGETYTVDKIAPTVISIVKLDTDPTNASLVRYDVTFSEPVSGVDEANFSITNTAGTFSPAPTITSITGADGTIVRRVTVDTGMNTSTSASFRLDLDSALPAITDAVGNILTTTFNSGDVYTLDNARPSVISIVAIDADPTNDGTVRYDVTFSEAVNGVAAGNFSFITTNGTFSTMPSFASITGADGTATRRVTVNTGVNSSPNATFRMDLASATPAITDAQGNALTALFSTGDTYTVDKIAPTVISIVKLDSDPTSASLVRYDVTFSEVVNGVDEANFSITNTAGTFSPAPTITSITGADGTSVRRVTVDTGMNTSTSASFRLDLDSALPAITDVVGNLLTTTFNSGDVYTLDNARPSVISIVRLDSNPTNADTVRYNVMFNEPVNGVAFANFGITATDGSFSMAPSIVSISGADGTATRRVTVATGTNNDANATFRLNLANVAPAITDALGNSLNATFDTGDTYTVDKTGPRVIAMIKVDPDPTNAKIVSYDVVFDENVFGVAPANFTVWASNGTFSSAPSIASISGIDGTNTRRVSINTGANSSQDAQLMLHLGSITPPITDALGNSLTVLCNGIDPYTVDNLAPRVLSITRIDANPTNADSVSYLVTFSEPVTGAAVDNFGLITNGNFTTAPSITGITGNDGTTTRTVTVDTGANSSMGATFQLTLDEVFPPIVDGLGNNLIETFPAGDTYTVDKLSPTVISIVKLDPDPTNASSVRYDVTFSESVSGVVEANFSITTTAGTFSPVPTITSITGADGTAVRRVTIDTGMNTSTSASFRLDLDSALPAITDAMGDVLTTTFNTGEVYTLDNASPTVIFSVRLDTNQTSAETVRYDVTFNEPVNGVALANFGITTTAGSFSTAPSIISITGADGTATRRVTVGTGMINGASATFRLDLANASPAITDALGNILDATFTTGDTYTVVPPSTIEFTFPTDSEGWEFLAPNYDLTLGVHNVMTQSLDTVTFTTNTFAIWESPKFQIGQPLALPRAGARPIKGVIGAGSLYRSTFNVSTNLTSQAAVPVFRLRSSADDFRQSDVLVFSSIDDVDPNAVAIMPTPAGRDYVQYFTQPAGQDTFRLDFDVSNFDTRDAAAARLSLNSVVIDSLGTDGLSNENNFLSYDFTGGDSNGFEAFSIEPAFAAPAEFDMNVGLSIRGAFTKAVEGVDQIPVIFGWFGFDETNHAIEGGKLYRVQWTMRSSADASNALDVPTFRLRVNSSSYNFASYVNVDSKQGSAIPTAGTAVTYDQYFLAPAETDGNFFIFSFDCFSVAGQDDPTIAVTLESVNVTSYDAP